MKSKIPHNNTLKHNSGYAVSMVAFSSVSGEVNEKIHIYIIHIYIYRLRNLKNNDSIDKEKVIILRYLKSPVVYKQFLKKNKLKINNFDKVKAM